MATSIILTNDSWRIHLTPEQWNQSEYLTELVELEGDDIGEDPIIADVMGMCIPEEDARRAVMVLDALSTITEIRENILGSRDGLEIVAELQRINKWVHIAHNLRNHPLVRWIFPNPKMMAYAGNAYRAITKLTKEKCENIPVYYTDWSLFLLLRLNIYLPKRRKVIEKEKSEYARKGYWTPPARDSPAEAFVSHIMWACVNEQFYDVIGPRTHATDLLYKMLRHGGSDLIRRWWDTFQDDEMLKYHAKYTSPYSPQSSYGMGGFINRHLLDGPHRDPELAELLREKFYHDP